LLKFLVELGCDTTIAYSPLVPSFYSRIGCSPTLPYLSPTLPYLSYPLLLKKEGFEEGREEKVFGKWKG